MSSQKSPTPGTADQPKTAAQLALNSREFRDAIRAGDTSALDRLGDEVGSALEKLRQKFGVGDLDQQDDYDWDEHDLGEDALGDDVILTQTITFDIDYAAEAVTKSIIEDIKGKATPIVCTSSVTPPSGGMSEILDNIKATTKDTGQRWQVQLVLDTQRYHLVDRTMGTVQVINAPETITQGNFAQVFEKIVEGLDRS
jgi:hypothetical protein